MTFPRSTLPKALGLGFALLLAAGSAVADQGLVEPKDMPGPLKQVTIDQHLGERLPLDAQLVDEFGNDVLLGDFYGDRPVILSLVYYECPMLCGLILNGVATSLSILQFDPGVEYDVVVLSFDHEEGPEAAQVARRRTLERFSRPGTEDGWHFLTGSEDQIQRVAEAAGYGYEYIPATDEWAHASGIVVTTPSGDISQYYYGIEYPPKDVRLAIVEASNERVGSVVDQLLLYCFRYDPQIGQYTVIAMRIVRLAGVAFVVGLTIFLWLMFRWESRKSRRASSLGAA